MLRKAEFPSIATQEDSASTTSTPSSEERQTPRPSATAGSVLPSSAETSSGKSLTCESSTPTPRVVTDVAGGLNWKRKGLLAILERLHRGDKLTLVVAHRDRLARFGFELIQWLVEQNGGSVLVLNQPDASPESELTEDLLAILHSFSCRMHGLRRYRTAIAEDKGSIPQHQQKLAIKTWLDVSRWTYNLTVEILRSRTPANWQSIAKTVMADVGRLHPEWEAVPYQVKRTAVRDACRAVSNVKRFNKQLAAAKAKGERLEEDFAELHFRSRKNPRQSCYIPDDAVTEHGVYYTILGPLRMAEAVPAGQKECRLVKERGQYWLAVPHPAQCDIETPSGDGAVALDPGIRTFLTFFLRNRMRQDRIPGLRTHTETMPLAG